VTQHASLSKDRWASFTLDQQILMIANEMNRAGKLVSTADDERRRNAYARVLQLVDLTVMVHERRALRRELLRWRDLAAALFIAPGANGVGHEAAMSCLLTFTVVAAAQRRTRPPGAHAGATS
jgi:hypothetical protein